MESETDGEYIARADIVLAPNAWRMTPELVKYVDAAIKSARAIRYPTKEKD